MATLPNYVKVLFDGYTQTRESGILRTEFENGPPRQARFKSRVMITRQAKLYIDTNARFQSFETWFANDIKGGSLFFTMTDPATEVSIEARFVGGTYSARPLSSSMNKWEISCQIESWSA
jgi:hypothetical protein